MNEPAKKKKLSISKITDPEKINNLLRNNAYSDVTFSENKVSEKKSQVNNVSLDFTDVLDKSDDISSLKDREEGPIIDLVDSIIKKGFEIKASDIHIEPNEDYVSIRYRVNGSLLKPENINHNIISYISARIKVLSSLNLTQTRKPQDGKIRYAYDDNKFDLRVSLIPSPHGERCVLRILNDESLTNFGDDLFRGNSVKLLEYSSRKNGIVIICGPTGSGKTTTLYSIINEIKKENKNIVTIEDPIEYEISGIGQTQVDKENGISFDTGLRALLRQDPDVILVGEIRDLETAKMAVQSSLTGHLVLTTLHTNTAIGALNRLLNLGVDVDMLLSTVKLITSQRLVKTLCTCKRPGDKEINLFGRVISRYYRPNGCSECSDTGYSGRVAIQDIIEIKEIKDDLQKGSKKIKQLEENSLNLKKELFKQVISGNVCPEQAMSVSIEMIDD